MLCFEGISLTPCFSWVSAAVVDSRTASAVFRAGKPLKRLKFQAFAKHTQLKQGVNEIVAKCAWFLRCAYRGRICLTRFHSGVEGFSAAKRGRRPIVPISPASILTNNQSEVDYDENGSGNPHRQGMPHERMINEVLPPQFANEHRCSRAEPAPCTFPEPAVLTELDDLAEVGLDGAVMATPSAGAEPAKPALERGMALSGSLERPLNAAGRACPDPQSLIQISGDLDSPLQHYRRNTPRDRGEPLIEPVSVEASIEE